MYCRDHFGHEAKVGIAGAWRMLTTCSDLRWPDQSYSLIMIYHVTLTYVLISMFFPYIVVNR